MILLRHFILILLLLLSLSSIAQVDLSGGFDFMGHPSSYIHLNQFKENNETGYFVFRQRYSETIGSPYWHEDEKAIATLILNDGSVIEEVPIQYDVYTDEIIATQEDQGEFIIDSKFFQEIFIDEGGSIAVFEKVHPDYPFKFYHILQATDAYIFFKDIDISYNIQEIRVTGLTSEINRFNRRNIYYINFNGSVHKINLKKRDLMEIIPIYKRSAVKQFAKQHRLSYKSEPDVIEILDFVFSLSD